MELLSYVKKLWCEKYSKGEWQGKYLELLTNQHISRIPHYIWKQNHRYRKNIDTLITQALEREIEERNMYIDREDEYRVKMKKPKPITKTASKFNATTMKKHNKIIFK